MDKEILVKKMKNYIPVKDNGLEERTADVADMTFINLRDSLIGLGTILDEDFSLNSYIAEVPAGIAGKNRAIVAIQLKGNKLYLLGYAKEGLINQHTAAKALDKVLARAANYLKQP